MRKAIVLVSLAVLATSIFGQGLFSINPEQFLGQIIKNSLERGHYRKLKVNDDLSKKAFTKFIEKLDYSKNFLLQGDIDSLAKYKVQFDDQLNKGHYPILEEAIELKKRRVEKADSYRKEFFKKKFDFTKNESIEIDSKKRKYAKTEKELKDLWRKIFKQSTLARYVSIKEEQKDLKENKKKDPKKYKGEKLLTNNQMLQKAYKGTSKKYKRYFERELQDERMDYLEKFFNSISEIFDPHTNYFPPRRKEDFDIEMSGSLEGIGAVLQEDEEYIKVVRVVPGGAAWRQKELEVDDKILAVSSGDKEPVDLVGMRVDDAVRYIRGPKGTVVKLHVRKTDGSRKVIPIVRDVIVIGESFTKSSVLELKGLNMKVGYVHVPRFYREFGGEVNCTDDVRKELKRLKKQKVDAVILDLRGNGGGALDDAAEMSGLFINRGPIVQIKDGNNRVHVMEDRDPTVEFDGPLVVMINRISASASEILAAALQDYGRAVIVGGEFTHGKGTVQTIQSLDRNLMAGLGGQKFGALKLTIQKFYRINGDSTQFKGITPDIILPDPFGHLENREKDYKYSLPWDKISPRKYSKWTKSSYNLDNLRSKSKVRVSKDKRMQNLVKNLDFLKKRKKDTKVTLNLNKWLKEEKDNKKILDRLKLDKENKELKVSNFEASLKSHSKIKKGEEKQWQKDFKKRKDEWVKSLRKDSGLEEAMYIVADMIEQSQKRMVYTKAK